MKLLIDYLTLDSKIHNYEFFIKLFGLDNIEFISLPGRNGWQNRFYYQGISIFYNNDFYSDTVRTDICIELSGTGCRTIESIHNLNFDWLNIFKILHSDILVKDVTLSRLDIACDDLNDDNILKYNTLVLACKHKRYICKARYCMWQDGSEQAIYFGSPKSDRRLRIYNKQLEQKLDNNIHWIRVEMQMRNDNAISFILNWLKIGDIGSCYSGVLFDFLRFVTKKIDNGHHSRAIVSSWWLKFVGDVQKISQLYLSGFDYNISRVCRFLHKQASSSLKLWLEVNHGDLTDILDMIDNAKLNYKQLHLLDKILANDDINVSI